MLMAVLVAAAAAAQTGPCGRNIVVITGADKDHEERFIPAPPPHVKDSVVRALPAVGANLEKTDGLKLTARDNSGLLRAWQDINCLAGVKGSMCGTAYGTYDIELRPDVRDGVAGTYVQISFRRPRMLGAAVNKGKAATVLIDEIGCVAETIGESDPTLRPPGPADKTEPTEGQAVVLPEGTPLKLTLREPLYSGNFKEKKGGTPSQVVFEVAEPVKIDGVVVIRKGALGVGHITQAKTAGRGGKGGILFFAFDKVTAADGQPVEIGGLSGGRAGGPVVIGSLGGNAQSLLEAGVGVAASLIAQALVKGQEVVIRAGTTFEVETTGNPTIRGDR
jgi:hypothetical protein